MLFRAFHDPAADADRLYSIGFTTSFDQSGYDFGYRMAQIIEKYEGKTALAALLTKNPLEFFKKHIALYRERDDPDALRFSPAAEKILLEMQVWNDRL